MTKTAVYLIGPPGAGKSSVLRTAVKDLTPREAFWESSVWSFIGKTGKRLGCSYLVYPGGIELGRLREPHSGTDALPMDAVIYAEEIVSALRPGVIIAEGSRLANRRFLDHLWAEEYALTIVSLDAPDDVLAARRAARAELRQVRLQKPEWVKGQTTKMRRLAQDYRDRQEDGITVLDLDATASVEENALRLYALPAFFRLHIPSFFAESTPPTAETIS